MAPSIECKWNIGCCCLDLHIGLSNPNANANTNPKQTLTRYHRIVDSHSRRFICDRWQRQRLHRKSMFIAMITRHQVSLLVANTGIVVAFVRTCPLRPTFTMRHRQQQNKGANTLRHNSEVAYVTAKMKVMFQNFCTTGSLLLLHVSFFHENKQACQWTVYRCLEITHAKHIMLFKLFISVYCSSHCLISDWYY